MLPVRFEPTISAGEWPQTYALDRATTGTGSTLVITEAKRYEYSLNLVWSFGV